MLKRFLVSAALLAALFLVPAAQAQKYGLNYAGNYSTGSTAGYSVGDVVGNTVSGTTTLYLSLQYQPAGSVQPVTSAAYWVPFGAGGSSGASAWVGLSGPTYAAGQIVTYSGCAYYSNAGGNYNNAPSSTSTYWTQLGDCVGAAAQVQANLNIEATTRGTNDATLQTNINSEAAARASADSSIQASVAYSSVNVQSGSAYTLLPSDCTRLGGLVKLTSASAVTVTLPAPTGTVGNFPATCKTTIKNLQGSGFLATLTPVSGVTVDGNASYPLYNPGDVTIVSDGTNWVLEGGSGVRGAGNLNTPGGFVVVSTPGVAGEVQPGTANGTFLPTVTVTGGVPGTPTLTPFTPAAIGADPLNAYKTVFGPSGSGHSAGAVPDPGATAGATRYLREDGTWNTISASGSAAALSVGFGCVVHVGDSLTAGGENGTGASPVSQLAVLDNRCQANYGIYGQTSSQANARYGITPAPITSAVTIPTSGSVALTFTAGAEPAYNNFLTLVDETGAVLSDPPVYGTLNGVPGALVDNSSHVYNFTPTIYPGSPVAVSSGTNFVPSGLYYLNTSTQTNAPINLFSASTQIYWLCRNDITQGVPVATIEANITAAVNYFQNTLKSNFIIVGCTSSVNDNSTQLANIATIDAWAQTQSWAANFINILPILQAAASTNGIDALDVAAGYVPYSLRATTALISSNGALAAALATTGCPVLTATNGTSAGSVIKVDSEYILTLASSGDTVTSCTRGYGGSTAATHTSGTLYSSADPQHINAAADLILAQQEKLVEQSFTSTSNFIPQNSLNVLLGLQPIRLPNSFTISGSGTFGGEITTNIGSGIGIYAPGAQIIGGSACAGTSASNYCWSKISNGLYVPGQMESNLLGLFNACNSAASPAVCGSSAQGAFTLAAGATTEQVNTTAITSQSQVVLTFDASLGSRLGVTCNTTNPNANVTARANASTFTITAATAPTTNPACYSYTLIN